MIQRMLLSVSESDLQREKPEDQVGLVAAVIDIEDVQSSGSFLDVVDVFVGQHAHRLAVRLETKNCKQI